MPVCLIGYALDEYNAAPRELKEQVEGADAATLAALFNHLGREMVMMRNDRLGKAEFRKLRQRPEETLREFARRVKNIGEGQPVTTDGIVRLKLHLGPMKEQEEFVVVPHCEPSFILGLKFLKKHKFFVDFGKNELPIPPLSPEPLKMMVVTWSEDESRCYQRSTNNIRESVETEHSRSAPSTQHLSVFESRNPRWDSGDKPPPGRWDAMIIDSEADFRMVSTTASGYQCDGSRCLIVTTLKPHQKTFFGNVVSDGLLGNLEYEEIEGDLFS